MKTAESAAQIKGWRAVEDVVALPCEEAWSNENALRSRFDRASTVNGAFTSLIVYLFVRLRAFLRTCLYIARLPPHTLSVFDSYICFYQK